MLLSDYHTKFSLHPSSHIDAKKEKNVFILVMRTLRTYSFNKFPIYHTAVLTVVAMLYIIPPELISLVTESFYLLTVFILFLHMLSLFPITPYSGALYHLLLPNTPNSEWHSHTFPHASCL